MWWVRKFYKLPPTDPRFLAMTTEQMELEWEHYLLDNPDILKDSEQYKDPEYEKWEQEAAIEDHEMGVSEKRNANKNNGLVALDGNEDWEEVEIEIIEEPPY